MMHRLVELEEIPFGPASDLGGFVLLHLVYDLSGNSPSVISEICYLASVLSVCLWRCAS